MPSSIRAEYISCYMCIMSAYTALKKLIFPSRDPSCFHLLHALLSSLVDTTPPVITVPSSSITRVVELGTSGVNVVFPEPTATDISGTANLVSRTAQPGDFFPVGQTDVTYTFQDPSGNPVSGTVNINVVEGKILVPFLSHILLTILYIIFCSL